VALENDYNDQNNVSSNEIATTPTAERLSDPMYDVTRIRLVQFQRNTDEPLVRN